MNKADAFHTLEELRQKLLARIPPSAPKLRARYLRNQVEGATTAAGRHLAVIYETGLEVGSGLSAMPELASNPKYAFWLEGIRRHLQTAEATLDEQPA